MRLAMTCMVVVLGTAAQRARAELPMSAAALGQLEAVLEHCGKISPDRAGQYQALAKGLGDKAKPEELAEARQSAEYLDANAATRDQLAQLPKDEAEQACLAGLPPMEH